MTVVLTDRERAFVEENRAAAMVTLREDGTPHAVRVGVVLVDGRLWISGRRDRVRTGHLRRDPRSTIFVFGSGYGYLTLECTATILEGPDVPELSVRLFREMQRGMQASISQDNLMWEGKERTAEEFVRIMEEEGRLIYELDVNRSYGLY
jgi:PPOX class probable F420-dependent enzyme